MVVVLTDPPGVVLSSDGFLSQLLKRLDILVVRAALSHTDGVIALTPMLAADLAPDLPCLIMEGILGTESAGVPRECPADTGAISIVYAGGLSVANGVDRLVEAVKSLPVGVSVHLRPLGKGPLAEWLDEQSATDARIGRAEYLPRKEVLRSYQSADLLVQPRPVNEPVVGYSFPSKLLEYMASGTPVLSTRLPGIPDEYEPHLCWIDDDSVEGIRAALERVLNETPRARRHRATGAKQFVASLVDSSQSQDG
jgi:glycosyltransferase involved in cell wall biosynthesis